MKSHQSSQSSQNERQLVELFIVGQPKSGTTALASFLDQHPDICMSMPKEPHYFATDLIEESDRFHGKKKDFHIRTEKQYHNEIFKHHKSEQILGEASTGYLFSKTAAQNIYNYNPNAKIIISLREPVSLLHSLHMQYINETTEDEKDFEKALAKEEERKKGINIPSHVRTPSYLYYSERVKYTEHLQRFFNLFPKENILIFTFEEFKKNNQKVYSDILSILDLEDNFTPNFKAVHESKKIRLQFLNSFLHDPSLRKVIYKIVGPRLYTHIHKNIVDKFLFTKAARAPIDDTLQLKLKQELRSEVEKVSKLIGKDMLREWEY